MCSINIFEAVQKQLGSYKATERTLRFECCRFHRKSCDFQINHWHENTLFEHELVLLTL